MYANDDESAQICQKVNTAEVTRGAVGELSKIISISACHCTCDCVVPAVCNLRAAIRLVGSWGMAFPESLFVCLALYHPLSVSATMSP